MAIQVKRGTKSQWETQNPKLDAGQPGFEIDTNKLKIGDGTTNWNSLPYIAGGGGTPYTHIRYAMDANGLGMTDKPSLYESNGRNLYTRTRDFSGAWAGSVHWTTDGTYNGFTVKKRVGSWNGLSQYIVANLGEEYTLMGYVKNGDTGNVHFYGNSTTNPNEGNTSETGLKKTHVDDWTKISVTFQVTVAGSIRPRFENSLEGGTLYVCGLKLERGSNSDPIWTPAPGDYPKDYVQPYIGIAVTDSPLAPTDSSMYQWFTNYPNDPQIGGRNYIQNSAFVTGKGGWTGSNGTAVSFDVLGERTVLKIDTSTSTEPTTGYAQQTISEVLLLNTTYTLSFWVYSDEAVIMRTPIWNYDTVWILLSLKDHQLQPGWNKITHTFATGNIYEIVIGLGGDKPNIYYVFHPKLELGNVTTDWTPSIEDVQNQISNLNSELVNTQSQVMSLGLEMPNKQNSLQRGTFTGDINTATTEGIYWCNFANITNSPVTGYGYLRVERSSTNSYVQTITTYNSDPVESRVIYRYFTNAQWYDWVWLPYGPDHLFNFVVADVSNGTSFSKDFLMVALADRYSERHKRSTFVVPVGGSGWSNVPFNTTNNSWVGVREVFFRTTGSVGVTVNELYPVPGRVWTNYYTNSTWTGWTVTPVSLTGQQANLNGFFSHPSYCGSGALTIIPYSANGTGTPTNKQGVCLQIGYGGTSSYQLALVTTGGTPWYRATGSGTSWQSL